MKQTGSTIGIRDLARAARKITTHLELDQVLGQVVSTLTEDLGGTCAAIWTLEHGENCLSCGLSSECINQDSCLHLKAWDTKFSPVNHGIKKIPLGVMRIGEIAGLKSPYITDRVHEDPLLIDTSWARSHGIISFAGFPLAMGERLLGVLAYFSDREIDRETADALQLFAHQASAAVEDALQHEKVRNSERHYKALMDGAVDAVVIFAPDGRVMDANDEAGKLFGLRKETFMTMKMEDLGLSMEKRLGRLLKDGEGDITYEAPYVAASGESIVAEVRAGVIKTLRGRAAQVIIRDVTERKKTELQKADLLSMVAHDLKGPLSVIMGYSEVIREHYLSGLPDFVKEGIESIFSGSERLSKLVDDYLQLSRMEAGMLTMDKAPVSLQVLLTRVVESVLFRAEEKNIRLTLECPPGLPMFQADARRLERAVMNLLLNAIAHTPEGGAVTLKGDIDQASKSALIEMRDNGKGIAKHDLPRIFDKYYTSGSGGAGSGTGLGLAIVKSIAEGHGGKVAVESQVGKGSSFKIILPTE